MKSGLDLEFDFMSDDDWGCGCIIFILLIPIAAAIFLWLLSWSLRIASAILASAPG